MNELLRATWVIARRDFTALTASKAFLLFLVVPLIFAGIGLGATMVGGRASDGESPRAIGLQLSDGSGKNVRIARDVLESRFDVADLPRFSNSGGGRGQTTLSGTLDHPTLTGPRDAVDQWRGKIALVIDFARHAERGGPSNLSIRITGPVSDQANTGGRATMAQSVQATLFVVTLMLGGMMLSNLVEEKTSKVIEVLAASVSIDAIFLGKLLAMLGVALIALAIWAISGVAFAALVGMNLADLAAPATGWPLFLALIFIYFTTAFMLLGGLLLGIGSLAGTVREVQMLSMPVTIVQLLFFFLASSVVHAIGKPLEIVATLVPFSSPFAMVSRAAQQPSLVPHLLAIFWQTAWVVITVRVGSILFRRNVLMSGTARRPRKES